MRDLGNQIQPVTAMSREQRRAASLAVADRAESEQDCRLLLEILGLLPERPVVRIRATPATSGWRPA